MNLEERRLETLRSWPVQTPITKETLARAGFFYSGNGTEVTCFSCGGRISEWNFGDRAIEKHRRFYPSCEFVKNGANNVPYHPSHSSSNYSSAEQQQSFNGVVTNSIACSQPSQTIHGTVYQTAGSLPNFSAVKKDNVPVAQTNGYEVPVSARNGFPTTATPGSSSGASKISSVLKLPNAVIKQNDKSLKSESMRLKTFEGKWPLPFIRPIELARAGFYYLQVNDKVKCVFCDGVLMNWERNDNPMAEHARNFPLCPFICRLDVGNVAMNMWDVPAILERGSGQDVCGSISDMEVVYSGPENRKKVLDQSKKHVELTKWGVYPHEGPIHASQAVETARLRSFASWPVSHIIKPEKLAAAGFFYIGVSDHTKCFYCDGGLCNWEVGDDPWTEHARWFGNCTYLKLNKGEEFIRVALSKPMPTQQIQTAVPPVISAIHHKVDEVMNSSMLQAFLATNMHQPGIIRTAVLELVREKGVGPKNLDELTEMIYQVKEEERRRRVSPQNSQSREEEENQSLPAMLNIEERKSPVEETPPPVNFNFSKIGKEEVTAAIKKAEESKGECSVNVALEEENRLLKEQRMCKICMDQEVGIVFLPCGHLISCPQCATAMKDCALCRTPIKGTIRTFLS